MSWTVVQLVVKSASLETGAEAGVGNLVLCPWAGQQARAASHEDPPQQTLEVPWEEA